MTDLAGVLDDAAKTELASRLRDLEQQTTAEVAVATVATLDGMTIEEYANRLFREWGIGKKGKDNGVLILVAPTERKVRIEVGYGLEPILPDGLAGEIIRKDMLPAFKDGHYPAGILGGVNRVAAIIEENHTLTPDERKRLANTNEDRPPRLLMIPFFGLFVGLGALSCGIGLRARSVFPILWGAIFGGVPFIMALIPFFNAPVFVLGPLALACFALGYVRGGRESWMRAARGVGKKGHVVAPTGWVMGSSSSSSSGGGSGSGGGFGGGSSGGGGASGSW